MKTTGLKDEGPGGVKDRTVFPGIALLLSGLKVIALMIVCCSAGGRGYALEHRPFEVEGLVTFTQCSPRETNVIRRVGFHLFVEERRYGLRFTSPTNSSFDYQEVAYDGTNLYYVLSFESQVPEMMRGLPRGVTNANVGNAFLYRGPILHNFFAHEAGPIWLALGSGYYFAGVTNNRAEAVLSFDSSGLVTPENVRTQSVEFRLQSGFPCLPERVVFFESGTLANGWTNPPPYHQGFTSVVYEVVQARHFNGIIFPGRSILKAYYMKPGAKANTDLHLALVYDIEVTSVRFPKSVSFAQPRIPVPSTLVDTRFSEIAGSLALGDVATWPSEENVLASAEYQRGVLNKQAHQLRQQAQASAAGGKRSTIRRLSILFGLVVVSAFCCWALFIKRNQNTT